MADGSHIEKIEKSPDVKTHESIGYNLGYTSILQH